MAPTRRSRLEEPAPFGEIRRALHDSEERFRLIVEHSTDGIVLTGEDGRVIEWNKSMQAITGLDREAVLDRPVMEIWAQLMPREPQLDAVFEQHRADMLRLFETGASESLHRVQELQIRRADGQRVATQARIFAIETPEGYLVGAILRDITELKRIEQALQESEQRYRTLFQTMAQGVVYQDASGKIVSANPAAERILGLKFDEMQGRFSVDPCWQAIHEDGSDFPGEDHPAMVALRTGAEVSDVIIGVFNPRDGSRHWVNIHAMPLYAPGSAAPLQVYTTFDDITVRKQAEEEIRILNRSLEQGVHRRTAQLHAAVHRLRREISQRRRTTVALRLLEARYRAIIEDQTELICRYTLDGRLTFVNRAFCEYYGKDRTSLTGQRYSPDLSPADQERLDAQIASLGARNPVAGIEYQVKLDDGEDHWQQWTHRAIMDDQGRVIEIQSVGRDVTEQKHLDTEIQNALDAATRLNRLKSRFIATVSHEFRTPLSVILSSVQLLEEYGERFTQEKRAFYLQRVQNSIHHLADLLDDILVIERVEEGKWRLAPETIDLVTLAREMTDELNAVEGSSHNIRFKTNVEQAEAYVDQMLLRRIYDHLLSNAIKYSPPHSSVSLTLTYTGQRAVLKVTDRGRGIPEADLPYIFESFFRGSNTGDVSGLGLGLAVVKGAVTALKGTIRVTSKVGEGTIVIIEIPTESKKENIKDL